MTNKSCFECKHIHTWDSRGSLYEPCDSGWECGHKDSAELPFFNSEDVDIEDEKEFAVGCAKNCPGFEFFDWDAHYVEQVEAEAEYKELYKLTPDQEKELQQLAEQTENEQLIEISQMTPEGELTDEHYRAADFAYDCRRERR